MREILRFPSFLRYACGLLAAMALAPVSAVAGNCNTAGGSCVLGVFPHTSLGQIEATYAPITEELGLAIDRDVQLRTSRSMGAFVRHLHRQDYDIALTGIGQYLNDAEPVGYRPIARRDDDLVFEIIALPDSGMQQVADLAGHTLGLVPASRGTTAFTLHMLRQNDRLEAQIQTRSYASQQSCIHALLSTLVDACGVAEQVKEFFEAKRNMHFAVLAQSDKVPNVAWVVRNGLNPELVRKIRRYLLERPGYLRASPDDYDVYRPLLKEQQ